MELCFTEKHYFTRDVLDRQVHGPEKRRNLFHFGVMYVYFLSKLTVFGKRF